MSGLQDSWSAFSPEIASRFLNAYGYPSATALSLLGQVFTRYASGITNPRVLLISDALTLGLFFEEKGLSCVHTGVDFSQSLLDGATARLNHATFVRDDVEVLSKVVGQFDIAFISRVLDRSPAPEDSLMAAAKLAKVLVIRFFAPPEFDRDTVELCWMAGADGREVPYILRQISRDYYHLILARIGCKQVDVFIDRNGDQIHVLVF